MRRLWIVALLLLCLPMVGEGQSIRYYPPGEATDFRPGDILLWEEFCGGSTTTVQIGTMGWSLAGVANNTLQAADNDICLANFRNASASGVGTVYLLAAGQGATSLYSNFRTNVFRLSFGNGANVPDKRVGVTSTALTAAPADDAVYFECLAADTNWFSVTRDGAAANQTRKDTGVAFSAGTRTIFRIDQPSAGVFQFSINGTLVTTHSGAENIPAQASAGIVFMQLVTTGTANLDMAIDYWGGRFISTR